MSELYAKLFVDTRMGHADILKTTADAVKGQLQQWTIEAADVEIDVRPNDDYNSPQRALAPDDFLYFPFALDVEASSDAVPLKRFLDVLSQLMQQFATAGMRVVVACDWEDDLPGGGRLGFESE
jgi:hypothetical protein